MSSHSPSHKCVDCASFNESAFCSLSAPNLDLLERSKIHHAFKVGQTIFFAGHEAQGIYCIKSGTIKLEVQDEAGKTQIAQVYSAGDVIGYRALFSDGAYLSNAIVVEPTEVCFIPKATILKLVQTDHALALTFLKQLSNDFRMMEARLHRASANTAIERIAEALLFLRDNFQEKNWTRKEIAEWAGTTPETVIRTLADFEAAGYIRQEGRIIHILKRDQLLTKANITI